MSPRGHFFVSLDTATPINLWNSYSFTTYTIFLQYTTACFGSSSLSEVRFHKMSI